jgi:hypothetical protein
MAQEKKEIKFRLYYNGEATDGYPWLVQEKGLFFWGTIKKCRSEHQAKSEMQELASLRLRRKSGVVSEYTEQDYLADVLKQNQMKDRYEGYEGETQAQMVGASVGYAAKDAAMNQLKRAVGINKI